MDSTMSKEEACCVLEPTGVPCPACGEGTLEPARGRFGPIYKCTNTAACKVYFDSRPTGELCSFDRDGKPCGSLIVQGTKTIPDRCSDRSCPNRFPHKLPERLGGMAIR